MRIIAGSLGGRQFDAPSGHRTHPMSDKVRGAIFNLLGDVEGLVFLDAFAGSGALGFEALSRGARHVTAVEVDKSGHKTISDNTEKLGLSDSIKIIRANVSGWSDNNPNQQFDVVLCDPPYDKLQLPLIQKLARHVKPDGLMVLSFPGKTDPPEVAGLNQVAAKNYGDASVIYYKKAV